MNLINAKQIEVKTGGRSPATRYRDMRDHGFPKPIYLVTGGKPLWDEAAVDGWLEERIALKLDRECVAPGVKKGRPRRKSTTVAQAGV